VLGTQQLAELADEYEVQEFVMISTDKAVNPTSVMGVSKQMAERFVHAFSEMASTKFVVVRFGNVLASNGSVVPIFQEQIRRGGPITVTHPEIERFFMTIPEASQLVLQAAAMGRGGEIYVLDMGESVRIVDLARDLIRLSGLQPDDIEIAFTGLRPGEKLYEELYFEDEEMQATPHSKIFVAYHRPLSLGQVREAIRELADVMHGDPILLRTKIKQLVPEYECPEMPKPVDPDAIVPMVLPQRHTNTSKSVAQ
jgi:FlaA1/EpsC-like NDP-sugar epimerase